MATADELIQIAWNNAHDFPLWNGFLPEEHNQTFPNAVVAPSGYAEEDGPLSDRRIEANRFQLSIVDTDRRSVWALARKTITALEKIEDPYLTDASANMDEYAQPIDQLGNRLIWEIKLQVTLTIFDEPEE